MVGRFLEPSTVPSRACARSLSSACTITLLRLLSISCWYDELHSYEWHQSHTHTHTHAHTRAHTFKMRNAGRQRIGLTPQHSAAQILKDDENKLRQIQQLLQWGIHQAKCECITLLDQPFPCHQQKTRRFRSLLEQFNTTLHSSFITLLEFLFFSFSSTFIHYIFTWKTNSLAFFLKTHKEETHAYL